MSRVNVITNTFTANSQNKDVDVDDADLVVVGINGTYALTLAFFVSDDGTNWYPFNMTPANSATPASTHAAANATQAYTGNVTPYKKFRVSTTAFTSGSASVRINVSQQGSN